MKLSSSENIPRFLGAAFLVVIATSLIAGLFASVAGNGSISDVMVNISNDVPLARVSIIGGVANSACIVVLAALLYVVLSKHNKTMATVALGMWLAEAIFYAIAQLGALALIPLSRDFVASGSANSSYESIGGFLYNGVYHGGMTIHMWFYCTGGILWYYMFFRSRFVPRPIPLWGVFAVIIGAVGVLSELFGVDVPIYVYIPILPFELAVGLWLVLKGIEGWPPVEQSRGSG